MSTPASQIVIVGAARRIDALIIDTVTMLVTYGVALLPVMAFDTVALCTGLAGLLLIAGLIDASSMVFAGRCLLADSLIAGVAIINLVGCVALTCIFAVSTESPVAKLGLRTFAVV